MLLPQNRNSFVAKSNIVIVVANHRHKSHDNVVVDCFHFYVRETCRLVEIALPLNAMEAPT